MQRLSLAQQQIESMNKEKAALQDKLLQTTKQYTETTVKLEVTKASVT